jgi:hypothetical protein
MIMMVEVDLQGITGEGVLTPRFTVEITGEMLMKIGRLIAMQNGVVPDEACDVMPVAVKFVQPNLVYNNTINGNNVNSLNPTARRGQSIY